MNTDLLASLENGATLVTPNQRLALHLQRQFDSAQQSAGRSVWPTPDILPLSAFIERSYTAVLHAVDTHALPPLLSAAQETALWEESIRRSDAASGLLSPAQAALQCRAAWQIAHVWRLLPRMRAAALQEDAKAFLDWAGRYESACRQAGFSDNARSADLIAAQLAKIGNTKTSSLIVYGFDITTPQHAALFEALANAGCNIQHAQREQRDGKAQQVACASCDAEISACAKWVRTRLDANPAAHIGIVVPDLNTLRQQLASTFTTVLAPAHGLPGAADEVLPFNFSLGEALSSFALVHDALLVLDSARGQALDFELFSALMRTPFIAGAQQEMAQRARLDAALREACGASITLERLHRTAAHVANHGVDNSVENDAPQAACPILLQRLARFVEQSRSLRAQRQAPAAWARDFAALLATLGFPGERILSSHEYQTLEKFRGALATLVTLEAIAPRMRYDEALARLTRIVADTLFQPKAPEVPVQILGVLEAAGLAFDHLWVMGLTEEAWPMPARPNPFLPVALQRAAGVPESSALLSLQLDQRITQGWLIAAHEVVLSYAVREGERELLPSPLIAALPQCAADALKIHDWITYREVLHASRRIEQLTDDTAPPFRQVAAASAGAALFRNQAACPFRAMARHRLAAQTPATPAPGLDAAHRGTLLHAVLTSAWLQIKTKTRLDNMPGEELDALLFSAAQQAVTRMRQRGVAVLDGRFAELEQQRLQRLVGMWLDYERARNDFEVVACEQKSEAEAGGVRVRIKLDRMDRLADGAHAIIDYKTGAANVASWLGARPDEPQLPLYLFAAQEDIAALAFARIKLGKDLGFDGIGREDKLMPGVTTIAQRRGAAAKQYASWDEVLVGWRGEIEALGRGFASGVASVDPKHGKTTCAQCDLQALCRINEIALRATDTQQQDNAQEEGDDA